MLPKSRFGQALTYLRNHWGPLQLYLADGHMPIDNNDVEQLMKQIALGRKNWIFIGSMAAGERAADFFTLVASAVRNDLDVWAYLKDVLDRLLAGETDYESLRPTSGGRRTPKRSVNTASKNVAIRPIASRRATPADIDLTSRQPRSSYGARPRRLHPLGSLP